MFCNLNLIRKISAKSRDLNKSILFIFQTVAMEAKEEADRNYEECELSLFAAGEI